MPQSLKNFKKYQMLDFIIKKKKEERLKSVHIQMSKPMTSKKNIIEGTTSTEIQNLTTSSKCNQPFYITKNR